MRSVALLQCKRRDVQQLDLPHGVPAADAAAICWRHGVLVTARINSSSEVTFDQSGRILASLRYDAELDGPVVSFHHNPIDDRFYLIMAAGHILECDMAASPTPSGDVIGTVEEPIEACEWTADGEVVAIATRTTLSLLTRRFDLIAEIKYKDSDIKLSANQVSVGWGRSDTQFKGKHAKGHAPRDPTLPDRVDAGTLSPLDDGRMHLSWRGDGQYVALSSVAGTRRVIRVYSRDGNLESTSEPVDGQEGVIAWRPLGNIMASVKRSDDRLECIFFEKNGLRHGEFELRNSGDVSGLRWNCDSNVLAIVQDGHLELWAASNYQWELKQRLSCDPSTTWHWHPTDPYRLAYKYNGGWNELTLHYKVLGHRPTPPNDYGLVARVDGDQLGLTPLRIANVPPPMSMFDLRLAQQGAVPRHVSISPSATHIAVLYETSLDVYTWTLDDDVADAPSLSFSTALPDTEGMSMQVVIADDAMAHVLFSTDAVIRVDQAGAVKVAASAQSPTSIVQADGETFLHESTTNKIVTLSGELIAEFAKPCHNFDVIDIDGHLAAFGLSVDGDLFANSFKLASEVSSFLLFGKLLLYTTTTHLKFVHLSANLDIPADTVEDERSRLIDRGSVLVTACPTVRSVVLQAPRGNLETIYPRILVLAGIRAAVKDRQDWATAWRESKVHRIDPNIFYDLDPQLFLANVSSFVAALKTSTELDLFLANLKPEDVTRTMYVDTLQQDKAHIEPETDADKVNRICQAVLDCLTRAFIDTHFSSILTAHLAKSPPAYEAALGLVASIPDVDEERKDDALTHVTFIADVNELYNQALGIYNLDLAAQLARRNPLKDPREYLPFIEEMRSLPDLKRKYVLDNQLKRYPKALDSLLAEADSNDSWAQALAYIQKHELWSAAFTTLRNDDDRAHRLLIPYAEHMSLQADHAAAGRAFEMAGAYDAASAAYRLVPSAWRECLATARLAMSASDSSACNALASELADTQESSKRFADAAIIHHTILRNEDRAIEFYCRAFDYATALLLAGSSQAKLDKLIRPRLTEHVVAQRDLLNEMATQLASQLPRLREVRKRRVEDPTSFFEGFLSGGHGGLDDTPGSGDVRDDISLATASDATTSFSIFTRYTGVGTPTETTASSQRAPHITKKKQLKLNRKQERKRAKGKQGTVWEEEYLVNSIGRLGLRLGHAHVEIRCVIEGLLRMDGGNGRRQAADLQRLVTGTTERSLEAIDEAFTKSAELPQQFRSNLIDRPTTLTPFTPVLNALL
ncbi:Putative elongator complex protein 1 [Savitreella phatthalungensis]